MKGLKVILLLLISHCCQGQYDTLATWKDKLNVSGYIKDLQIFSFDDISKATSDNLIHNRINIRYFGSDNLTIGVDFRNRIFTGETVKLIPGYGELIAFDPGYFDFSWAVIDKPSVAFVIQMDRAWIDWNQNNWEIRVGRQRINWGTNLFWNSNDLFNAYSLVDFDYEEQPGADAIRVQRHFANLSTLDLAIRPGNNSREWIAALRYGFNRWGYDFQTIIGKVNEDYTFGIGWAGNIKDAGFKGEVTYFRPSGSAIDQRNIWSSSISVDYIFSNQLFLTGGFLLNSGGVNSPLEEPTNLFLAPITAKNLMPSKFNTILSASFPLTPLAGFAFNTVYSPGVHSLLLMTSLSYSISNNWEIALFGQNFFIENQGLDNIGNGIFIRTKGSF